jgi:hypothetical protein
MTKTAGQLAKADEEIYEHLMEGSSRTRGVDPESARQKFYAFVIRALGVLAHKQTFTINVAQIISASIKVGTVFGPIPTEGSEEVIDNWISSRRHQANACFSDGIKKGGLTLPAGWELIKKGPGRNNSLKFTPPAE